MQPTIPEASQLPVFPMLEIQTGSGEYDGCDCNMTAHFSSLNGNCSTEVLRNYANANWHDDFNISSLDNFTGSVLGTCKNFNPEKNISVTITHKGPDGWMGTDLKMSFS